MPRSGEKKYPPRGRQSALVRLYAIHKTIGEMFCLLYNGNVGWGVYVVAQERDNVIM